MCLIRSINSSHAVSCWKYHPRWLEFTRIRHTPSLSLSLSLPFSILKRHDFAVDTHLFVFLVHLFRRSHPIFAPSPWDTNRPCRNDPNAVLGLFSLPLCSFLCSFLSASGLHGQISIIVISMDFGLNLSGRRILPFGRCTNLTWLPDPVILKSWSLHFFLRVRRVKIDEIFDIYIFCH